MPVYLVMVAGRCGAFNNVDYAIHRTADSAHAALNRAAPLVGERPIFGVGYFKLDRNCPAVGSSGPYGSVQAWIFSSVTDALRFEPRARIEGKPTAVRMRPGYNYFFNAAGDQFAILPYGSRVGDWPKLPPGPYAWDQRAPLGSGYGAWHIIKLEDITNA